MGLQTTWWRENRTSVRMAFVLKMITAVGGTALTLLWTRLIAFRVGDEVYGMFLTVAALITGGSLLGDFGLGPAIGLRTGQLLANGDDENLNAFLGTARTLWSAVAVILFVSFCALTPWMREWLGLGERAGSGNMSLALLVASVNILFVVIAAYYHSLNFAVGTVTWPLIPQLLLTQLLAPLGHYWLARLDEPLWLQLVPYALAALLTLFAVRAMAVAVNPKIALPLNLRFRKIEMFGVLGTSSWLFLSYIANAIYRSTDTILINHQFGPAAVLPYRLSYRFCEWAALLLMSVGFFSFPKINQWMADPNQSHHDRVRLEINRIMVFQTLVASGAALTYLALNNEFIRLWMGANYRTSLELQFMFALNLTLTVSASIAIQTLLICGTHGVKTYGLLAFAGGLLNLVLSLLAMRQQWMVGIAAATVVAQFAVGAFAGWYFCPFVGLSRLSWGMRSLVLPAAIVALGYFVRTFFTANTLGSLSGLLGLFALLLVALTAGLGITPKMFEEQYQQLRKTVFPEAG